MSAHDSFVPVQHFVSHSASCASLAAPFMSQTKVGLVSLGCAKNLIDSEIMIGHLQQAGMIMTPEPELADVLIINTCSFIDMAKKESIGLDQLPQVAPIIEGLMGRKRAEDEAPANLVTEKPRYIPDYDTPRFR